MNVAADMMSGSGDFHEYDGIGSSKCEADARSIYKGLSFSSSASSHEHTVSAEPLDEERYNMAHPNRGTCVIFNNQVFQPHTNLSERRGSDRDEENLSHQFGNLGFRVFVYTDLTCRDICSKLDELGKQNYSGDDCFVCCILTHGGDGVLYGSDGKFPVDRVFKPFLDSACPTLRGKPKLFFIQACRGTQLDDGVVVALDTADSSLGAGPMLTDPDFLVAYSTVDGPVCRTFGAWSVGPSALHADTCVSPRGHKVHVRRVKQPSVPQEEASSLHHLHPHPAALLSKASSFNGRNSARI